MTTPAKQAQALRELADIIETDVLPDREYHEMPLHTYLFFRTAEGRDSAYQFFQKCYEAETDSAGNRVGSIGGSRLCGGVAISLIVPSLIEDDEDSETE